MPGAAARWRLASLSPCRLPGRLRRHVAAQRHLHRRADGAARGRQPRLLDRSDLRSGRHGASPPGVHPEENDGPRADGGSAGSGGRGAAEHEHHADNIDAGGRALLRTVPRVLTTRVGAERLGGSAVGLAAWEQTDLPAADGRVLQVTATPCRHGPAHLDRGPVIGFALAWRDAPATWSTSRATPSGYEGVAEVARRFRPRAALLFLGAARVAAVGPWPLTMTASEAVEAARALAGGGHRAAAFRGVGALSESREDIASAFARAGLADRLRWPVPGRTIAVA